MEEEREMMGRKEIPHVPASKYPRFTSSGVPLSLFAGSSPYAIIIFIPGSPRRRVECEHGTPGVLFERNSFGLDTGRESPNTSGD